MNTEEEVTGFEKVGNLRAAQNYTSLFLVVKRDMGDTWEKVESVRIIRLDC